jgi:hypothetical protein
MMNSEVNKFESGLTWRSRATGVIGVGWIAFLVLWLFLYASEFDVYKNIVIVLVSIIAAGALIGVVWGSAMKGMGSCMEGMPKVKGLGWRMLLSMVIMTVSAAFFLVWFYFFAVDYSIYQNLGILIVQIIATFGVLGATWKSFKIDGIDENSDCCSGGCPGC